MSAMSLIPQLPNLVGTALPARAYCSADYGLNIRPSVCTNILRNNPHWPRGSPLVQFYLQDPAPSDALRLPFTVTEAGCTLSIEAAGPAVPHAHIVSVSPEMLANRANFVIRRCPTENNGIGGFVTYGFRQALNDFFAPWGAGPDFSGHEVLARKQLRGLFLTISVYGDDHHESQPGDTDPTIGGAVARAASNLWRGWNNANTGRMLFRALADFFRSRTIEMTRGGTLTWWEGVLDNRVENWEQSSDSNRTLSADSNRTMTADSNRTITDDSKRTKTADSERTADDDLEDPETLDTANYSNATNTTDTKYKDPKDPQAHGDMTYQCDSSLGGAPKPIDCEKLLWSGLKPPDSVETFQAHVPKYYSQGTCALGISSASTTTVTWAHLLAAFETLYNLCVRNPISSPKGGRAYYGQQAFSSWINGKRDSVGGVSGSEALPVGINATIFKV